MSDTFWPTDGVVGRPWSVKKSEWNSRFQINEGHSRWLRRCVRKLIHCFTFGLPKGPQVENGEREYACNSHRGRSTQFKLRIRLKYRHRDQTNMKAWVQTTSWEWHYRSLKNTENVVFGERTFSEKVRESPQSVPSIFGALKHHSLPYHRPLFIEQPRFCRVDFKSRQRPTFTNVNSRKSRKQLYSETILLPLNNFS